MYAVSQDFLEKTYALSRNVKYRVTCDGVTYTEADNLQSVNFYDSANSGTDLTVGSVCCNEVDIRLLNVDDVSFDGKEITVEAGLVIDEETIEYVPLGVFIVEEGDGTELTSVEGKKIVELKAFDRMSKFDTEFNADLLTETITAGELMAAICEELDVPLKTAVFPNSDYVVGNSASINTTYRKMVSYIAQLAGCFARFDRDGELELRWYAPVDLELTSANYMSFQAAENTVPAIDKLSVKVEENDLGISYGSGENEYSIINNPLLYGLTAEPEETQETVLKNIFNNIAGIYTDETDGEILTLEGVSAGTDLTRCIAEGRTVEVGTGGKASDNPYELIPGGNGDLISGDYTYAIPELNKINTIADEYNLLTGELTKRIGKVVLTGNESIWAYDTRDKFGAYYAFGISNALPGRMGAVTINPNESPIKCTHFNYNDYTFYGNVSEGFVGGVSPYASFFYISIKKSELAGWDDGMTDTEKANLFKAWIADQYANGTPVTVYYQLETPVTDTLAPMNIVASETMTQDCEVPVGLSVEYKKPLIYIPYEANVRANPALETGDIVKITLANGSEYIMPIMNRGLSYSGGMTETYSAVGTSLNYTKPRSVVNEKIEALRRKTNVLESTLDGTKSQVTLIAADVGDLRTTLEQTATGILSEVSQNYPDNTTVQSMIQQATDAVSLRFSQTGGRNAIKDSCGIYGLNAWTKTGTVSAQDTTDTTAKKCIVITNGSAEQTDIDIVPDTDYILCFRYKTSGTGVSEYAYSVNAETPVELEDTANWQYVVRNFRFTQAATIKFIATAGTLYISDLVLLQGSGDIPVVWQQAEGETHNGTVKISEDGIVIGRYTSEFEGTYTQSGVYYKNKYTQQDVANFTKDGAMMDVVEIKSRAKIITLRCTPSGTGGVFESIDD